MIRPFEFLDLRHLYRYRKQGVYLDSASVLTKGKGLAPVKAALAPISEAMGVYTAIYEMPGQRSRLIGQASHTQGAVDAHFTFLTPEKFIEPDGTAELVEYLVKRMGEHKAQVLVADVDEKTTIFEILRQLSFSIFARQRIWRIKEIPHIRVAKLEWREMNSQDEFNTRRLYHAIVPTMVQQVESPPSNGMNRWVFYDQGDLLGYVDVMLGTAGVWVQPFIHPEMENVGAHLTSLLASLLPREHRPVFVCLRSYQAGLSTFLEDLDAEVSSSQAVMVRRLTAMVKKPELVALPSINGTTEVTTPYNQTQPINNGKKAKNKPANSR
jgi:hypothetical protein